MAAPLTLPQPQSIRAIFFDVGYTLLAPHPSVIDIVVATCAVHGITVDAECLTQSLPHAERYLRRHVKNQPWTWSDEAEITSLWRRYFAELLRPCLPDVPVATLESYALEMQRVYDSATSYKVYPDVVPVLQTLRERPYKLGVISDWGMSLWLILRHHDLVSYFDFAVISAAVRLAKPDPQLFATALQRADEVADYTIHIGDAYPLDVLGARATGITPVLLDRRGDLDPAQLDCIVIHDLYELLDLLEIPRPDGVPSSSTPPTTQPPA